GKTTPEFFEKINLRLAHSVTARNALGRDAEDNSREIATMLYGEIRPDGHFRVVNFGHPPPLVFSAEYRRFAMKPCPLQFRNYLDPSWRSPEGIDDPQTAFRVASEKLRRHWARAGFKRVNGTDYWALCPARKRPS